MKKIAFILLVLMMIAAGASGQILKGAGIIYFDSIPNVNASTSGAEIAFSIKQKALYKWNRTTFAWDLVVKDTSAFNEIQLLYASGDTLYLTDDLDGVSLKPYKNRLHLIATLADTTSITDEVEGDVAYITGGDTLAFRDSLYWLPFFVDAYTDPDPDPDPTNEIQQIDTFSFSSPTLSISLSSDGVAAKTANLSGLLSGYVTGSGTAGRVPRWTSSSALGDGVLRDDGTLLALGGVTVSGYSFYDYSTGAWRLATGTTAQRPTNIAGLFRYNTSLGYSETGNGSVWLQSDFPAGTSTYTLRHNGTSWIASSNLINTGSDIKFTGTSNRFYFFPNDFTDGQTFNGQLSLLNNAESFAQKMAIGASHLWLRIIGGLSGTGRGLLIAPNGAAVLTATNTLVTMNTATDSKLQSWMIGGTEFGSLSYASNSPTFSITGNNSAVNIISNSTATARGLNVNQHNNSAAAAIINYYKSRGTSTSPATAQNGDAIGAFTFNAYNGTSYLSDVAYFGAGITGTVTGSATPTSIYIAPGSAASNTTPTILAHHTKKVGIGDFGTVGSLTEPARLLEVKGEARITDLTTDTPTRVVGADADGDLNASAPGFGLSYTGGTLQVDSTKIATLYDVTSIGNTLYTGDGTIATDRTVTMDEDISLTITGSAAYDAAFFNEKIGVINSGLQYGKEINYSSNRSTGVIRIYQNDFSAAGDSIAGIYAGMTDFNTGLYAQLEIDDTGNGSLDGVLSSGSWGFEGFTNGGSTISRVGSDDDVWLQTFGTGAIQFRTGAGVGTIRAVVNSTGLGINDTSPEKSLDVGGMGKFRQLSGQDNSVTIGTNANAGTGRSASITDAQSSDVAGRFSFTTGTTLTAGEWVTLTWATAFDNPPAVVLMPENANAASITPYVYVQPSTTGCSIAVNVTGVPYEGLTYTYNYIVIQGK